MPIKDIVCSRRLLPDFEHGLYRFARVDSLSRRDLGNGQRQILEDQFCDQLRRRRFGFLCAPRQCFLRTMIFLLVQLALFSLIWPTSYSHLHRSEDEGLWNARTIPLRQGNASAVRGLLKRIIPEFEDKFLLVLNNTLGPKNKDTFLLVSVEDNIKVEANSAIGLSMGVHYYLKYLCKAHISWSGDQLHIPQPLPVVRRPIIITTKDKYRHYQNVCTVSYSMVWWNWTRWEREIDWMALNGINLPLAFTAQEAIWRKVFLEYNFTESEINDYFTGPAFLAWHRMGNIQSFGGPLSPAWHEQRICLQKRILERMREFGMRPIAPAFAGRVLQSFKRIFPEASVTQNSPWSKFKSPFCCTSILDPEDPLFLKIGTRFLQKYQEEFGTDGFFSADLFNEMAPPTSNTSYLESCGKAVFQPMTAVDKEAVWVMQAWVFVNDPGFWKPPQAKALLTSVPLGKMLVLDLEAEFYPQYGNFESFYGQPFIWCIIHNYGGVDGLYGSFDAINQGPFKGRRFPNSTMIGTGLTPEGIEKNDVIYDLMNEMAWRDQPVDIDQWIYNYTERRYGKTNENITNAWKYLKISVYNATRDHRNHGIYIFNTKPSLSKTPYIWYDPSDVRTALPYFINGVGDPQILAQKTYQYDVVDFTRQGMQLLLDSIYFNLTSSYFKGDLQNTEVFSKLFLALLEDLEVILYSSVNFQLEPWLQSAAAWASSSEEEQTFDYNARNQITLWGPNGEISDYANKQWAGIISCYIKPRWEMFTNMLRQSLIRGTKFNQTEFNKMVLAFVEEPFTFGTCSDSDRQKGDPVNLALQFLSKHGKEMEFLPNLRDWTNLRTSLRSQLSKKKNRRMGNRHNTTTLRNKAKQHSNTLL